MLDYTLPADDPLGVLTSTRSVIEQAEAVRIDPAALARIAAELGPLLTEPPEWHDARHFADGTWRTAGWVLALDALNFCFWSTGAERWQVEWQGRPEDGYWALATALSRAVEESRPVWDPRYLAGLTPRDVAHILRPYDEEAAEIPLFPIRVQNLHEVARGLLQGFPEAEIPIQALIAGADGSAVALVQAVVERFPSFNDVARYRDQEARVRGAGLRAGTGRRDRGAAVDPDGVGMGGGDPGGNDLGLRAPAADSGGAGPAVPGDRDRLDPLAGRSIPPGRDAALPPHPDDVLLGAGRGSWVVGRGSWVAGRG
jgi:hypothetical protein